MSIVRWVLLDCEHRADEQFSTDKKCPFTGLVSIRGRILTGKVVSTKMHRTLVIRREYLHFVPKYDRYERRHKNLSAHVSPAFRVEVGDQVTVGQCRPLSKTVSWTRELVACYCAEQEDVCANTDIIGALQRAACAAADGQGCQEVPEVLSVCTKSGSRWNGRWNEQDCLDYTHLLRRLVEMLRHEVAFLSYGLSF